MVERTDSRAGRSSRRALAHNHTTPIQATRHGHDCFHHRPVRPVGALVLLIPAGRLMLNSWRAAPLSQRTLRRLPSVARDGSARCPTRSGASTTSPAHTPAAHRPPQRRVGLRTRPPSTVTMRCDGHDPRPIRGP